MRNIHLLGKMRTYRTADHFDSTVDEKIAEFLENDEPVNLCALQLALGYTKTSWANIPFKSPILSDSKLRAEQLCEQILVAQVQQQDPKFLLKSTHYHTEKVEHTVAPVSISLDKTDSKL